jgi:hypothetical protein
VGKTVRFAVFIAMCVVLAPSMARAQWYPYPPRFPYPLMDDLRGAVRIEVSPKEAEVYVDGYYAGIVDDFDGTFQRLRVTPGAHQIIVRRDGFHSIKEDVYLTPDNVHHIRRALEPLRPGEANEPPPTPQAATSGAQPGEYPPVQNMPPNYPGARRPPVQRMPPQAQQPREAGPGTSTSGSLVIRVQPGDAEILVDGEPWRGPEGDERLVVQLPEGMHRVEVRKQGFSVFSTDVTVRRGETVPLNVSLTRQ